MLRWQHNQMSANALEADAVAIDSATADSSGCVFFSSR
jgi:hypothetical protein